MTINYLSSSCFSPLDAHWITNTVQTPNTSKIEKNAYLLWHRQHDANFQGNFLLQATKRHINNSETVKNNDKWYERWSNLSFLLLCWVLAGRIIWSTFFDQAQTASRYQSMIVGHFVPISVRSHPAQGIQIQSLFSSYCFVVKCLYLFAVLKKSLFGRKYPLYFLPSCYESPLYPVHDLWRVFFLLYFLLF